jgi:hypothetical protein
MVLYIFMEYYVAESEFECDCDNCQNGGCECSYCTSKKAPTETKK